MVILHEDISQETNNNLKRQQTKTKTKKTNETNPKQNKTKTKKTKQIKAKQNIEIEIK